MMDVVFPSNRTFLDMCQSMKWSILKILKKVIQDHDSPMILINRKCDFISTIRRFPMFLIEVSIGLRLKSHKCFVMMKMISPTLVIRFSEIYSSNFTAHL